MDNSPRVTRAQLDDTRAALSDKLAALEQQMVDTVHGAAAVATQTVHIVKEAALDAAGIAKGAFAVRRQVDRHPWAMLGGSLAIGFVGGYLLLRLTRPPGAGGARQPLAAETAKLKKLAIGTLLGIVRDVIARAAPGPVHAGLNDVIDGVTVQADGEPIHGSVLAAGPPGA